MIYEIKPSVQSDAAWIADRLRDSDKREILLLGRNEMSPKTAVLHSFAMSDKAFTLHIDGEPAGIFGVSTINDIRERGLIWFLGTDKLEAFPVRCWMTEGKRMVKQLCEHYAVAGNWCLVENFQTRRWLEALGFKFGTFQRYDDGTEYIGFWTVMED